MAPNGMQTMKQKKKVAVRITERMYSTLMFRLSPGMSRFLRSLKIHIEDPWLQLDALRYLKAKLKKRILRGITLRQMDLALEGRHSCMHLHQKETFIKWKNYYAAWFKLAKAMKDDRVAEKIVEDCKKISSFVRKQAMTRRVNAKFYFPTLH